MFHLGTVLIASICIKENYEFLIIQIIAGIVAVQTLRQMTQRSQIVRTMLIVTLTMLAAHFIFSLMTANDPAKDLDKSDPFYWLIVSGLLLLFTYPLFWIMEKFFGFTSEVTLLELSNTNNPLLQKLMEEAPGTFQHSTQVAILASEVAAKVNANVQLVMTGALYHDIGKLSRPVFFTEKMINRGRFPDLPRPVNHDARKRFRNFFNVFFNSSFDIHPSPPKQNTTLNITIFRPNQHCDVVLVEVFTILTAIFILLGH